MIWNPTAKVAPTQLGLCEQLGPKGLRRANDCLCLQVFGVPKRHVTACGRTRCCMQRRTAEGPRQGPATHPSTCWTNLSSCRGCHFCCSETLRRKHTVPCVNTTYHGAKSTSMCTAMSTTFVHVLHEAKQIGCDWPSTWQDKLAFYTQLQSVILQSHPQQDF